MRTFPTFLLFAAILIVSCNHETPVGDENNVSSFAVSLPEGGVKKEWNSGDRLSVISLKEGVIETVDCFTAEGKGRETTFTGTYTGTEKASVLIVYPALESSGGPIFESAPLYGNETGFFRAVKGTGYILFANKSGLRFLQEVNAVNTGLEALCLMMAGTSSNLLFNGKAALLPKTSILKLELDSKALEKGEKVQTLTLTVDEGTPFTSYRGSMELDGNKTCWTTNDAENSFEMALGDFEPGNSLTVYVPVFPNNSGASLSHDNRTCTLSVDVRTSRNIYTAKKDIPAADNSYALTPGKEISIGGTLAFKTVSPDDEVVIGSVRKIMDKGPSSVCVDGNILYVGASGYIYALDITNPKNPVKIGSVAFNGGVRQMAVNNGKLVASARETGVWIFDVSNPANMSIITRYDGIELSTGIEMAGDCIFVGERQTGVEFVDARNIQKPQHIRVIKTPESQTVFYQNGYLYSGEWAAGQVSVFNAKDLSNIQQVATIYLKGYGDGLWVYGNRLYASTGHHHRNDAPQTVNGDGHGVEIWDVTTPENPKFISRVEFDIFYVSGIDYWLPRPSGDGKTLFCGDVFNGLYVVDISNEKYPTVIEHWEPLGNTAGSKTHAVTSVALADGAVYVTVSGEGLYVLESSRAKPCKRERGTSPVNLSARYKYDTPGDSHFNTWVPEQRGAVKSAAVYGNALFVGCGDAGLYTVKKDAYGKLYTSAHLDIPFAGGVAVHGDKLYVSRGHMGLGVYRIGKDLSLTEIALLKQELSPSAPINQFSYWVSAPSEKYIVNGSRINGYEFLAIGGTDDSPTYTFKRQYGLNLNYNRYISEKASTEGLLPYATRSGLVWINLSSTSSVPQPVVYEDIKNALTQGATLYKNNTFLLTRDNNLCTIAPGGSDILETSAYGENFSGIPRWESGDNVLVCNFVNRYVSKINTADFASPSLIFTEQTVGYPEPGLFWNGKCVVPCGYQGLLVEK